MHFRELPSWNGIDLRLIDLAIPAPHLYDLLDAEERARANRFINAVDRERFVRRRGHLRTILGDLTKQDPSKIVLNLGPSGKPSLASHSLQFNCSSSGDLALFAFCDHAPVGVDLEEINQEVDVALPSGETIMSIEEWVQHESMVKALGTGLSECLPEPARFEVHTFQPTEHFIVAIAKLSY